jgi:hypothetical protein
MFQMAYLIFAPLIGGNLQKFGRKNAIATGYGIIVIGTVGYGLIVYVNDE